MYFEVGLLAKADDAAVCGAFHRTICDGVL